ncbi:MAG: methyltransferase domain-containing protein [Flavobacteriales bacterium]|nr:methyltransferase domain-containing protein [Flavobacteriales bacterium]MCC6938593.1 methyltransferase domain-containing protein [Flavobacteriales bacterium]
MVPVRVKRLLSWLAPINVERIEGRNGPLVVRWEAGQLVLNSAHGNQSFGSLHRVFQDVMKHPTVRTVDPKNILLLGLGGGSVPRILRAELHIGAPITAVEWDPAMIKVAREHFGSEQYQDLTVVEGDATVQVHALKDRFDLVLVDLFDDLDLARGIDAMGFAHALRDRCSGVLCFNTVGYDEASDRRCELVRENLARVFGSVDELRSMGVNRVFIAR